MYKYILAAAVFITLLATAACKKFLDVVPSELVTSDQVWSNINNANGVLANLYSKMPGCLADGWTDEICAATDECYHHWGAGYYPLYFNSGAWNAANNPYDIWADAYQKIRQCNLFLENIDKVPVPENQQSYYATVLPRYKAEARVLRAFFYFDLFRRYGAVPILTRSYTALEAGEMQMPRWPVDSVVNFITDECEQAADILPVTYEDGDLGRISKGGALALATRTLVYAASPLFNGNPLYKDIKNPDGTTLFSQMTDREKWKRAADEALKVLNLNLYTLKTVTGDPINSYAAVFNTRNWDEIIVAKQQSNNKNIENECLPYGGWFGGWGKYSILQEFVDAYEMDNGYPIDNPSSGYDSVGTWSGDIFGADGYSENVHFDNISKMYRNRDPRFYATVTFQGSKWAIRHTANTPVWMSWWGANGGTSQGWPKSTGTYPVSGYNPRKWISPDVDMLNYWTSPDAKRNDPVIRLPEIYLIYAEALNEYNQGPTAAAFDAINKVRARVNMPALPIMADDNTLEGFRARLQNENRVEFAFEAHRFWDVRRWLIGTIVDNGPVHGLNARPSTAELQSSGYDVNSQEAGLSVFYKRIVIQTRVFQPKHYLFPIPQTEIEVNHQLVQNYGW